MDIPEKRELPAIHGNRWPQGCSQGRIKVIDEICKEVGNIEKHKV